MRCNGRLLTVEPGGTVNLKPDDRIKIDHIRTDGWITWGVDLYSQEVDTRQILDRFAIVRDLWPGESFVVARHLVLEARFLGRTLGRIEFKIQPGVRDLLKAASEAPDDETRISYLAKALGQEPNNAIINLRLAEVYYKSGDFERAARMYSRILSLGVSSPLLFRLLEAYKAMGKVDSVLGTYLKLLRLRPEREVFEDMISYMRTHKSSPQILRFLSENEKSIPGQLRPYVYILEAELYTKVGSWDQATISYRKAISAGVKDPNCYYNLSVTAEKAGMLREAIEALKEYLSKSPDDAGGWFRLARLLERSKDRQALLRVYEKLARLRPNDRAIEYNLGVLYMESKMWKKAIGAFNKVSRMDPRDEKSRRYLVVLYSRSGDISRKEQVLEELIRINPKRISYYKQLFELYDSGKNYRKMIEVMKGGIRSNPESELLYKFLLYAYLKIGDRRGAIGPLEKLVSLKPKNKEYLVEAVRLYEDLGNYEKASEKVAQILKYYPGDKKYQEEYLRLRMKALER